jgi:butyrate kinase
MENILIINPGSTSTKIALYSGETRLWQENIEHPADALSIYDTIYDQIDMRRYLVLEAMKKHGNSPAELTLVMARGGLIPCVSSGAYEITEEMVEVLRDRPVIHHASNLGAGIALQIARSNGIKGYIYDPVTVDEMIDVTRVTGLRDILRFGQGHNLNMRAAALRFSRDENLDYMSVNLIVAHLGGGISLSLHSDGRIIDMISDDDGPFSPERAGLIPTYKLLKKTFSGRYNYDSIMKLLQRGGGLMSHFETSDTRRVIGMAENGDAHAGLILEAMALNVAKCIAQLSATVCGRVDRIILTGGMAHSKYITNMITERVSFIAPVHLIPGENEIEALAHGGLRILRGEEAARKYKHDVSRPRANFHNSEYIQP